ncbi:hypothetical protein F2Q70_00038376 [Brassica cretica]|uniref:Uncharacterized protein n=1 Tax=Brassica cretica TaxID=69181 RepID=A0A8S9K197_BRACR|nr:hypothetical protein F2Q70_00038376 [Brassica cretica]
MNQRLVYSLIDMNNPKTMDDSRNHGRQPELVTPRWTSISSNFTRAGTASPRLPPRVKTSRLLPLRASGFTIPQVFNPCRRASSPPSWSSTSRHCTQSRSRAVKACPEALESSLLTVVNVALFFLVFISITIALVQSATFHHESAGSSFIVVLSLRRRRNQAHRRGHIFRS